MLGADMLLKSLGLDPEELRKQFETASVFVTEKISTLEAQLTRIEANQLLMYQLMARAGLIETVEQYNAAMSEENARIGTNGNRAN